MAIQINDLHARGGGTVTSGSLPVILPVCPSPSDLFTGRTALLKDLDELLTGTERRTVTIIAKGGSGKTQLVLKFVKEQKSRYIPNIEHLTVCLLDPAASLMYFLSMRAPRRPSPARLG